MDSASAVITAAHERLFDGYPPAVVGLTLQLRAAGLSILPEASERVYLGWSGIGFHHPTAGYVCGVFPGDDRVTRRSRARCRAST